MKRENKQKDRKENKKFLQKIILAILGIIAAGLVISINLINSENINGNDNNIYENNSNSGTINYGTINENVSIYNSDTMHDASIELYELAPVSVINYEEAQRYQIFNEQSDYSDPNKVYYYDRAFMSMIAISNNNANKEIILKNFKLVAENIVVNTMPDISLRCFYDPYQHSDYLFDVYVRNEGWGNANNIQITFEDADGFLNMLFNEDDLKVFLSSAEYGSVQAASCASFSNMNEEAYDELIHKYGVFFIDVDIIAKCDEVDFGEVWYMELMCSSNGIVDTGGMGYNADSAYAIIIDTDNDSFVLDVNIHENISAQSILELPLCFFPDKSCTFSYYVEFEVYDGLDNYTICTEKRDIEFFVSSCNDNIQNKDVSNMSKDRPYYFIPYPYATLTKSDESGEYYICEPSQQTQ